VRGHYFGCPIHINDWLGNKSELRQVRFPRSKKARIRKKWRKQRKNFRVHSWQEPVCFQYAGLAVMNSTFLASLKRGLP